MKKLNYKEAYYKYYSLEKCDFLACKICEQSECNKVFKQKKCRYCNAFFMPKAFNHIYCSHVCKNKGEVEKRSTRPKSLICKYCNKEYSPYSSINKYCSAECRINNEKSKRTKNWSTEKANSIKGENNPAYRNGNYCRSKKKTNIGQRLFERNRDKLKINIIEEYGYLHCQYCNISNSLRWETHHIIFRSEKPLHKYLHYPTNLVLLCIRCHNEFHKHKGLRNDIVKSRQLNKLFGDDVLNK